jgi:serine/threonine protein kinase/tetratricopeptide (TPR) repeat protein
MNEETLFHLALGSPPVKRAAFLDEVCQGDLALRRRVVRLLQAHDHPDDFLVRPALDGGSTEDGWPDTLFAPRGAALGPAARIGPYRLLHLIGEGGMGAVYLAEQEQPVQRRVALKLIKPGMDSRRVIARFEAERQALAMMLHPHIAAALDAGTTEGGRPYFVMELVEGVPITRFCDEDRLTLRQRLELFLGVCSAVQHAHQKGVIHRDIKPSNVLVARCDGRPVPKVIDFGVAKATGPELRDSPRWTELGMLVGTLEYMSPEQAHLEHPDVDTRSDVYSLGVLLYELLTGTTPLGRKRLEETTLLERLRLIREEEAPRASIRLNATEDLPAVAANRGLPPRALVHQVRGDLDRIAMKALEKDRNHRYETANGLAADLRRYLNDEPVHACPPSVRYRAGKFLRRNRRAVVTALVLLLAFGAVAGSLGWVGWDRAARLKAAQGGVDAALEEVERLHAQGEWPQAEATLRKAEIWLSASPVGAARRERARRWRRDLDLVNQLETIRLRAAMSELFFDPNAAYLEAFRSYGLDVEKEGTSELAARIRASAIKGPLVAALQNWGWSASARRLAYWGRLIEVGRRASSDPYRDRLHEALLRPDRKMLAAAARDRRVVDLPPATAVQLVRKLETVGNRDLAGAVCREIYYRRPGDPWLNLELAQLFTNAGRQERALGFWRAFLALRPHSADAHVLFANALKRMDRLAEAEIPLHQAVRLDPDSYAAHHNLGLLFLQQGRHARAEGAFRAALRARQPILCVGNYHLAIALVEQDKIPQARAAFEKACAHYPKNSDPVGLAQPCTHFASLLDRKGRPTDAVVYLRKAVEIQPGNALGHCRLAQVLQRTGRLIDARNAFRLGHQLGRQNPDLRNQSALAFRNAERLVYLEGKLPAVLRGEAQPRDQDERLGLADVCGRKRLYAPMVRLYLEAFAAPTRPEQLHEHRYNAACYAALAAGGHDGEAAGLSDRGRARFRRHALDWLRAELGSYRERLDRGPARADPTAAGVLGHWQADPDFNGVRGEEALARLPQAERRDWRRLWAEVEALRRRAAGLVKV